MPGFGPGGHGTALSLTAGGGPPSGGDAALVWLGGGLGGVKSITGKGAKGAVKTLFFQKKNYVFFIILLKYIARQHNF